MLDNRERHKMMANKLCELCSSGDIDNDWVETFVFDVKKRLDKGETLPAGTVTKLEEIFERN